MKGLFFIALFFLSVGVMAQCRECTSLADALREPQKVQTLTANGWQSENRLDSLTPDIGLLVNAEILYISDHNIKTIPKEIASLKKLKELSFAGCKLESLPQEIFTLTGLKELILLDNQFSEETKKALKSKFKQLMPNTKILL